MGLDTSLYSTSSVQFSIVLLSTWLLSYESFHKHKDIMYVFHAKFNRKTNQMKICCESSTYFLHIGRVKAKPTLALCWSFHVIQRNDFLHIMSMIILAFFPSFYWIFFSQNHSWNLGLVCKYCLYTSFCGKNKIQPSPSDQRYITWEPRKLNL